MSNPDCHCRTVTYPGRNGGALATSTITIVDTDSCPIHRTFFNVNTFPPGESVTVRGGAVRPAVSEPKPRGPHTHTKGDSYYDCPNDNCDIYDPQFANKLPDPLVCRHGYHHTSSAYVAVCNKLPNPHADLDPEPDRCRCGAESHPGHACADPATIANRNPYPAESCAQCEAADRYAAYAGCITVSYDGHTHRYSSIGEAFYRP